MESLDKQFAALADPTRRAILSRLGEGRATVAELAEPFAMSQPAISKHLKVLEQAGLVETLHEGTSRPRQLAPDGISAAKQYIEQMASYWPDRFDRLDAFLQSSKGKEE
ncbi:ArsR/SmtB family transcription factor [Sphingomicrobium sediminis]|uniref:Metalloregulator ArsR/SmtB family transcription factor n=1 Tax=Sphingomicrobium sediminis TaxID=2950949 RepID=A0A9X2J466_9SPHN|nr:metalloregulator ArsR/SmtB family transcription factor [Sphingomicrobium sediminis]MCM8556902.1 metalloregulator ArsR/SmtB family transcription factor [Sphingomicrobium sediminis]